MPPHKRKRSASPPKEGPSFSRMQKPTLFEAVDASRSTRTLEDNKAFFDNLGGDTSDSSLSSPSSSEFEGGDTSYPKRTERSDDDDGEEIDWEDAIDAITPITPGPEPSGDLEITLQRHENIHFVDSSGKKKGPSKIDRQKRIQTHCMHVQALLLHNAIRNAWVCDKEVQDILVDQLTPGVRKEWEKWKAAMEVGFTAEDMRKSEDATRFSKGRNGSRKGKAKEEIQSEWGGQAVTVPAGRSDFKGSDPSIRFLLVLIAFWKKKFHVTAPGLRKRGYKPLAHLASETRSFQAGPHDPFQHGERVADVKEFRNLAKKCEGSRDVGAQLFTALLKGLGLETKLVASLQPLGFGWSKNEDAAEARARDWGAEGNVPHVITSNSSGDENALSASENEEAITPLRGQGRASRITPKASGPAKRLERAHKGMRDKPIELLEDSCDGVEDSEGRETDEDIECSGGSFQNTTSDRPSALPKLIDKDIPFPNYWSEVFSTASNRYIPVDSLVLNTIATNADALASFEPRGVKAAKAKQVICYVIAYSSDRTAKDVTIRYLKRHIWPGKTKGARLPIEKVPVYNRNGKVKKYEEFDWFKTVMSKYKRSDDKRTWIDDLEDQQDLQPMNPVRERKSQVETLQGYKNSAEFVLERHLRREEAIIPGRKHFKIFVTGKGTKAKEEKVYKRSDIASCKTAESWHKEGREVKPREQALKRVPVRAVTLNRKREIQEAEAAGGKMMQGLYSKDQTQWIIPPPIVDGVIPKNAYGNMDCYVPSMVPKGAAHVRLRGTAKIARKLEIDYAEAVTGFEFGAQMAVPIIEGIVVAAENEQILLNAWYVAEEERRRKEDAKREKTALAMWRKFLMGLRIIERVREDYGVNAGDHVRDEVNPFFNKKGKKTSPENALTEEANHRSPAQEQGNDEELDGGFLTDGNVDEEEGGSIPSTTDEFEGAGGFIVDCGDSAPRDDSIDTANLSAPMPVSLLSTHRKITQNVSGINGRSNSEDEGNEDLAPEKRRTVPRRMASRKSEAAVRSHYFGHNSGNGDDTDARKASPKPPASKRWKTKK